MKIEGIEVNAIGFSLTDALKHHVTKRLRFALARSSHHIKCVVVRLSDINGPRGGHDKHCQIQCVLPGFADVVVEDTAADLYVAINRTAARANRAVAKHIRKRRTKALKVAMPPMLVGA